MEIQAGPSDTIWKKCSKVRTDNIMAMIDAHTGGREHSISCKEEEIKLLNKKRNASAAEIFNFAQNLSDDLDKRQILINKIMQDETMNRDNKRFNINKRYSSKSKTKSYKPYKNN